MDEELDAEERLILNWLLDRNQIQRNVRTTAAGKSVTDEIDVSGGLVALVQFLHSDRPLHQSLRDALADALDPYGTSLLQVRKRLRRRPGRPTRKSDTVTAAVTEATNVVFHGKRVAEARVRVKKRQPIRAVGTKEKKITEAQINAELGISHDEHVRRAKEHKRLFGKGKKLP